MSVISILTRKQPGFMAGDVRIEFDATLEDTLQAEVKYTQFPLEVGANATDHGIILPRKWAITAAVSNNPLNTQVTDFIGGFLSNLVANSALAATVAGISSGFLAGSDQTRIGSTLAALLIIMELRAPFKINAGEIELENMVITRIYRTRKPESENALLFTAELIELPTISTSLSNQQPLATQMRSGSPEQTQAAAKVEKGEIIGIPVSNKVKAMVQRIFPGAA